MVVSSSAFLAQRLPLPRLTDVYTQTTRPPRQSPTPRFSSYGLAYRFGDGDGASRRVAVQQRLASINGGIAEAKRGLGR